jgi:hypothetical protein
VLFLFLLINVGQAVWGCKNLDVSCWSFLKSSDGEGDEGLSPLALELVHGWCKYSVDWLSALVGRLRPKKPPLEALEAERYKKAKVFFNDFLLFKIRKTFF